MTTALSDIIFEHDSHFGDLINMIATGLYEEDREAHPIEQNKYYKHKKIPLTLNEKKAMRKVRLNKAYGTTESDNIESNGDYANENGSDNENDDEMDVDVDDNYGSKEDKDNQDDFNNSNSVDISKSSNRSMSSMDMLRKRLHDKIQDGTKFRVHLYHSHKAKKVEADEQIFILFWHSH